MILGASRLGIIQADMIIQTIQVRTADRTLMTTKATTMTILASVEVDKDLLENPKWPQFVGFASDQSRDQLPKINVLSCGAKQKEEFLSRSDLDEASIKIAMRVFDRHSLLHKFKDLQVFVSLGRLGPKYQLNRLMLRKLETRPLWKEPSHAEFWRHFEVGPQIRVEWEDWINIFGLARVEMHNLGWAISALRQFPPGFLLMNRHRTPLDSAGASHLYSVAIRVEHSIPKIDWPSLCADQCPRGSVIARRWGYSDDPSSWIEFFWASMSETKDLDKLMSPGFTLTDFSSGETG